MSDDELPAPNGGDGAGTKVGIAAGLLAALGGLARFADDCGRVGLHAADDIGRAGKPAAGLVDDAARPAHLVDDAARTPGMLDDVARPAAALDDASPLAKVAGDPPPGSGESWEELLVDAGSNVAFELAEFSLPEEESVFAAEPAVAGRVVVTDGNPAHPKELDEALAPGLVTIVVGSKASDGRLQFGSRRVTDADVHASCWAAGARCVVLTCDSKTHASCGSLAAGMGRIALAKLSPDVALDRRNAAVGKSLLTQRERISAHYIQISRSSATAGKLVRSGAKISAAPR